MHLSSFDIDAFLRDFWQQRPLLIRNPWNDWHNPLEPDELAGLACEREVESRLVVKSADGWKLEHGPLPAERFGALGGDPWTLLVQAVDHHVPGVAALLGSFRFIPNWRVDDVMVSYAEDGGGVGPHFDNYDVFLVQGLGRRRWRIGAACNDATELLPHPDLRLLADFEPVEEWVLEPGDMLYIPPGIAHDGVAVGDDCMTYSIGFRAPSRGELVAGWAQSVLGELAEDDRYGDPALARQDNPGEIAADALARLHAMIAEKLQDREAFARWFGQYATAPKNPEIDWQPEEPLVREEVEHRLAEGVPLLRNPAARFSFIGQGPNAVTLFVDGEAFDCSAAAAGLAKRLCVQDRLSVDAVRAGSEDVLELILELLEMGSVAFDEE
ncbi:MAG: cupin domain-containing protein [Alphaproteobacteria bacterium]|nr:cupin domain-containing protein [Alphaproteobacteria bacterium]